jgi:putative sterol carrier protein
MLTLSQITEGFVNRSRSTDGLDWGVLKIDLGKDGCILVDGNSKPNQVSNVDAESDCTITLTLDTLYKMVTGKIDSKSIDMKVAGDLRVAMALGPAGTDQPTPRMKAKAADRGILLPLSGLPPEEKA